MKTRSLFIAANWKMNPLTFKEAERIVKSLDQGIKAMNHKDFEKKLELVVCPPNIFMGRMPESKYWQLGAQNVHWEMRGAYTGETAIRMIEDVGCKYAIIGHSERRKYFGETNEIANLKLSALLKSSVKPIVCIGETKDERDKNLTTKVLRKQLEEIFKGISVLALSKVTVAYEPVWAISNGNGNNIADDPNDVMGIVILIRKVLAEMYRSEVAEKVRVIYGGSVNLRNIDSFLEVDIIDGFLIGGASLSMFDFLPILRKSI